MSENSPLSINVPVVSYDASARLVAAAVAEARALGVAVCVSVVDPSGVPRAFARMDGAPLVAVEMSRAKAQTALLGLGSAELGEALAGQLPQLVSFAAQDRVALLGGGIPILLDACLVGAIGVGGASTEQDIAIAEAALASLA